MTHRAGNPQRMRAELDRTAALQPVDRVKGRR